MKKSLVALGAITSLFLISCGPKTTISSLVTSSLPTTSNGGTSSVPTSSSGTSSTPAVPSSSTPESSSPESSSPSSSQPASTSSTDPEAAYQITPEDFAASVMRLSNVTIKMTEDALGKSEDYTYCFDGMKFISYDGEDISHVGLLREDNLFVVTEEASASPLTFDGGDITDFTGFNVGNAFQADFGFLVGYWDPENYDSSHTYTLAETRAELISVLKQCTYDSSLHAYHKHHLSLKGGDIETDQEISLYFENGALTKSTAIGPSEHNSNFGGGPFLASTSVTMLFTAIGTTSVSIPSEAETPLTPHKVTFQNEDKTALETTYVLDGHSVSYHGDTPEKVSTTSGKLENFKGWDKETTDVTSDLLLTAQFTEVDATTAYSYDHSVNSLTLLSGSMYSSHIVVPDGTLTVSLYNLGRNDTTHTLVIPASVTTINMPSGANTFPATNFSFVIDSNNTSYRVINNTLFSYDKTTLYVHKSGSSIGVSIPEETTTISKNAFVHDESLESVDFGSGALKIIGNGAFCGTHITEANLPASVESIGDYAFQDCPKLSSFTLAEGSRLSSIGNYAFEGDSQLTSVVLPSSFANIGTYCFESCPRLASVDLSACTNLTSIPKEAFTGDYALASLTLSANVTTFGAGAFAYCDLKAFTIAQGATLDESTFLGNPNIVFTNSGNANYLLEENNLYIDAGSVLSLAHIANAETCHVKIGTTTIVSKAAWRADKLKTLDLSALDSDITIGEAFDYSGLSTIVWPAYTGLTITLQDTFVNATSYTDSSLPNSVLASTSTSYLNCSSLVHLDLSNAPLTGIDGAYFSGDHALSSLILPRGLQSISAGAFEDCLSLKSLVIPAAVTSIKGKAFISSALATLYLEATALPSGYATNWDSGITSYYLYSGEKPTSEPTKYWHYVAGVPTVWPAE